MLLQLSGPFTSYKTLFETARVNHKSSLLAASNAVAVSSDLAAVFDFIVCRLKVPDALKN